MSDLSPQAQALIEAGRSEAPSAATKLQIKAKVLAEVGGAAAAGAGGATSASAAGAGGAFKLLATGALVLGLSAGALMYNGGSEPEPEADPSTPVASVDPAPVLVEPAPLPPAQVEISEPQPEAVPAAPVPASKVARRAVRSPTRRTKAMPVATEPAKTTRAAPVDAMRLAREARVLKQVRRALRDGAFEQVLKLAQAHEAEFPEGALRVERLAAQALAHCALGAPDIAQRHRAALAAAAPASAHLRRIDAACADQTVDSVEP